MSDFQNLKAMLSRVDTNFDAYRNYTMNFGESVAVIPGAIVVDEQPFYFVGIFLFDEDENLILIDGSPIYGGMPEVLKKYIIPAPASLN